METSLEKLKLAISHEEAYFKKSSLFNLKDIYIADYNDTSIFNLETDNSDEKDRKYRNKYLLLLLKTFENCCARCKISDKGIHLDHFMIPRSMNGTFILETKTGFKLHNAIPLCESCNTSKGDKDYRIFFNNEELKEIIEKFSTLPNLND